MARKKWLAIRLDEAEADAIRRRARAASLPVAAYVRSAALTRRLPRPIPAVNRRAWIEFARFSSNINQLAHAANAGRILSAAEVLPALDAARREMARLRALLLSGEAEAEAEQQEEAA